MNQNSTAYLSLGSNLDDRLKNLQDAVDSIHKSIAKVIDISPIYTTPAWGFSGAEFQNICIKINTSYAPSTLLDKVLQLEKKLGRQAKETTAYENRSIDIDIILFDNKNVQTEKLIIPHPRALERKFVLIPLKDIFNENYHPFNFQSLLINIENCKDKSNIEKLTTAIKQP